MTLFSRTTSPSRPRWDGTRVFFEIADGNEQIQCAISRAALEEISDDMDLVPPGGAPFAACQEIAQRQSA
jgi:hypothetical protein